ncbi:MAG: HDOD domain-containing protein [Sulfurimonas sp.]|jgi:HD-like signal output (HDOD) protein
MGTLSTRAQHVSALPPMPDSIIKIQKISNDPMSSLRDLALIIQQDPMLTANILKLVNSPIYALKEHVNSVQQAISMFGISSIVGFAMANAIEHTLAVDLSPYGIAPSKFLDVAQTQNALAFHWMDGLDSQSANILLTSSFLMEMGSLLISDYIIKEKLTAKFHAALLGTDSLDTIETNVCGFNHQSVGATMFETWDFDDRIVQAIRRCSDTSRSSLDAISSRLAVISTAVNLKDQFTEQSVASAIELANTLGLDGESFKEIVNLVNNSNRD